MNTGRAVIGASTVGALLLAAALGIQLVPTGGLSTNITGGGVCGTFPEGTTGPAAWFMAEFDNDTEHDVHVRTARIDTVERVRLEHLAIAPHQHSFSPGLIVTEDATQPEEYGDTVPVDSGVVVRTHRHLDVIGRIVLERGRSAGYARGVVVTTEDWLGGLHTASLPIAFGVGIGEGHDASEIGCDAT